MKGGSELCVGMFFSLTLTFDVGGSTRLQLLVVRPTVATDVDATNAFRGTV